MKRMIVSSTGTCGEMAAAFSNRIKELSPEEVVTDTEIDVEDEDELPSYQYQIQDNRGLPQTGLMDTYNFEEWWEVEEFLDNNPDVYEDIENGYATVVQL